MFTDDHRVLESIKRTQQEILASVRRDYAETLKPFLDGFAGKNPTAYNIDQMKNAINEFICRHNLTISVHVHAYSHWQYLIIGADWVSQCAWEAITRDGTSIKVNHS